MKIAITTGTFHPESGGPPTYLHRLGRELVERGHDLRLLTFGEPSGHRYLHPVIRVSRRLPLIPRLGVYTTHAARLAAWSDLLFVSDYGLPPTAVTRFIRRPLVVKIVADFAWETASRRGWIHGDVTSLDFQKAPKRGRVAALERVQRFYATRATRVIVPSRYVEGMVVGWGVDPARLRVVHNAVDVERFETGLSRDEAKARLGLSGLVVLTLARLIPLKGVDHVIGAIASLRERHALTLVHCGDGPDEARLRGLAAELGVADRVRFEGHVPQDLVPTYVRAADMLALYSTVEGLSHALLEAMAGGLPAVVSDRGGNPEVVEDRVTGRVVSRDDPGQLAAAIDELASSAELRRQMGERARLEVGRRFGWSRLVDQTLGVFEEALAAFGRGGC